MESSGAVQVLVDAFEKRKVVIKRLCCDDDSSIRADCQWSNADYLKNNNTEILPKVPISKGPNKGKLQDRPDKGKLPAHVPKPLFVADPNHRRKGLTGELIKLDASRADLKFTMTRMDSTRIGKNFGYMARTLKDRNPSEYVGAAQACLEHHFDSHQFCGDWCKTRLIFLKGIPRVPLFTFLFLPAQRIQCSSRNWGWLACKRNPFFFPCSRKVYQFYSP
jgi:hypothetical protein